MTESSDADKLVAQLNEYFWKWSASFCRKHGTLQKFIGDAIMAAWGDTHSEGLARTPAARCSAALQMRAALAKLNGGGKDNPTARNCPLALASTTAKSSSATSAHPQRMEFTVLGDGVNLAARLESATKQFHTDILVGEQVEKLTREHFIYRTVDLLIAFKGKTRPMEVFTLLSDRSQPAAGVAGNVS